MINSRRLDDTCTSVYIYSKTLETQHFVSFMPSKAIVIYMYDFFALVMLFERYTGFYCGTNFVDVTRGKCKSVIKKKKRLKSVAKFSHLDNGHPEINNSPNEKALKQTCQSLCVMARSLLEPMT